MCNNFFSYFSFVVTYEDTEKINAQLKTLALAPMKLYLCAECSHAPFKTKSGRDKHEISVHSYDR
jgi:hypothetical protein